MSEKSIMSILYFLIFATLSIGVSFCLLTKALLPWSYYALTFIIGALIVFILSRSNAKPWFLYASLLILSILIQNIYNLASGFKVIPLSDSYNDYVAIRIFMENGRVYQLQPTEVINPAHASAWPLGPIFTMVFSLTSGINVQYSSLIVPSIYGMVQLLFIMLFLKTVLKDSVHEVKALVIGLLFFAIMPDAVYDRMIFYHRFFAKALYLMAFYLVAKEFCTQRRSKTTFALLVLLSFAIAASHSLASSAYVLYLFYFIALAKIGKLLLEKYSSRPLIVPSMALPIIALIAIYSWNEQVYPRVFGYLRTQILRPFSPILGKPFFELEKPIYIPSALATPTMVELLTVRDLLIYLPAFLGTLIFLVGVMRKKNADARRLFLFYSLIAFGGIFLSPGSSAVGPLNFAATYFLPLVIYFAVVFYTRLLTVDVKLKKVIVSIVVSILLIFLISMAFLAPWSHRYFANFLYDPSVKPQDVSMHNPAYLYMIPFVEKYVDVKDKTVLSDDVQLSYLVLPPQNYEAVGSYRFNFSLLGKPRTYIFEFMHLNPELGSDVEIPKNVVEVKYNKVLDAYQYAVYYKEHA